MGETQTGNVKGTQRQMLSGYSNYTYRDDDYQAQTCSILK